VVCVVMVFFSVLCVGFIISCGLPIPQDGARPRFEFISLCVFPRVVPLVFQFALQFRVPP
jgi:hypothetical protein